MVPVKAHRRLVDEENSRLCGDGGGNRKPPALAFAESQGMSSEHTPEVQQLDQVRCSGALAGVRCQPRAEFSGDLAAAKEVCGLMADVGSSAAPAVPFSVRGAGRIVLAPADGPGCRPQQAGEDLQQRGLARAVGAANHRGGRRGDVQIDIREHARLVGR